MYKQAKIIQRSGHNISRTNINDSALKVLYRLHHGGYKAHLVGGCVRDLLLNRVPKDFDVVTDAHPEQIKQLFENCRLIGRRFRLAHVMFGRDIVEVATFRGQQSDDEQRLNTENGRIVRDNVYGDIEEDIWRRDFTMNALYYNIADFSLIDYAGALDDIRKGVIRLIGDPQIRYREDPVRMLRAIRFAAKLGFKIDRYSAEPIYEMGHLLKDIPSARLFDEVIKLFHGGHAVKSFDLLRQYGLFEHLFPATHHLLEREPYAFSLSFIQAALTNTDIRINQGKPVTPAFLFAIFLWLPLLKSLKYTVDQEIPGVMEMQRAASRIIHEQHQRTTVPRRFTTVMRDIWTLQPRLQRYKRRRALQLLSHLRFRAGYDFLYLRAQAGEAVQEQSEWWTEIQQKDTADQLNMAEVPASSKKNVRRKRRTKKKGRNKPATDRSDRK